MVVEFTFNILSNVSWEDRMLRVWDKLFIFSKKALFMKALFMKALFMNHAIQFIVDKFVWGAVLSWLHVVKIKLCFLLCNLEW